MSWLLSSHELLDLRFRLGQRLAFRLLLGVAVLESGLGALDRLLDGRELVLQRARDLEDLRAGLLDVGLAGAEHGDSRSTCLLDLRRSDRASETMSS